MVNEDRTDAATASVVDPEIPDDGAHPEEGEGDEREPDGTDGTEGGGV